MSWRARLLLAIGVVFVVGELWMVGSASSALRANIALLTAVFVVATGAVWWHYRQRIDRELFSSNVALGAIVHLALVAGLVGLDRLVALGLVPALAANWHHFLLGGLGIGAAAISWTRARGVGGQGEVRPDPEAHREPASEAGVEPVDWDRLGQGLDGRPVHQRELARLRRIDRILTGAESLELRVEAARRALAQEGRRVADDARASEREEDDALSQAASLLAWGAQKLPELAELDVADLLMGKVIAEIRARASDVERRFVDHRALAAIHPIDRDTANAKCDERADAARAALPLLRSNGMRLSEELIQAHEALHAFRSVTGFQVVELDGGRFVTFEGNGRREALQRAFGADEGVQVEVRLYRFDDPALSRTIRRRVERVRRWKGVVAG